jgi:hypothetical protein
LHVAVVTAAAVTRKLFGAPDQHVSPDVPLVRRVPPQLAASYALTVYVQPAPLKTQPQGVHPRVSS